MATWQEAAQSLLEHSLLPGGWYRQGREVPLVVAYAAGRIKTNLWMLEGFAPNTGILARLGLR